MSSSRNTKILKDITHTHKLELIRLDRKADIRRCVACTQGIIDSSYYNCPEVGCDYLLHKFCGELPLEMKHGFHQAHPVKLTTESTDRRRCNACLEMSQGYFYTCKECNFDLDFICATMADRKLEHHGHPHPLTLLSREIETYCNCCGKPHKGIFYQCQICAIFWIHQDCAALGPEVNAPNHPHPLHFVYSGQIFDSIECEICYKVVDNHRSWYLQCVPCKFLSHVHCAMDERKYEEVGEIDSEIPRLPWEDCDGEFGVVELVNRKKSTTNDEELEKEEMKINHFSHPEHELILQAEVPKVEDPYHGHPIPLSTKCNGCTRKISSPFYSCLDCDFFLHKCCALLPSSIPQHPFHSEHHQHNLVQSRKPWRVEEVFLCCCCWDFCNGFCFECEEESCEYKVDVECAFLPTSIVHKAHPFHLLTLTNDSDIMRKPGCCGIDYTAWSGYECNKCEYIIHMDCAMYPAKASHRYDHENPFKLWYDRGAVEANYFYCERCEDSMDPKAWYYHSKTSIEDQLMHPRCILQREHQQMFKFKSTKNFLQVDIHPHRLHLSTTTNTHSFSELCGYCANGFPKVEYGDEEVDDLILSYNCWEPDCGFRIHFSCLKKLHERDLTSGEEYLDERFQLFTSKLHVDNILK